MKSSVAFMPAGLDACALYRMFLPHLRTRNSVFIFNPYGMEAHHFAHCKVVMVQRLSSQENFNALQMFRQMGMKILYDLDDDLWSVPHYNPAYQILKKWMPGFEVCSRMADVISVSTQHLKLMVKEALGKQCPRIEVVENCIDYSWFRPLTPELRKNKNGRVTMGWAGSDTHSGDVAKVFGLVPELMRTFPQLDFELVGMAMPEEWKEFGARITHRDFVPVAEYATHWASWQWDISLAPVAENSFNLSKSNIKMLEAAAMKIPCVATKFGEYDKFASHSRLLKDTVMAVSLNQWRTKLSALIMDEEFRKNVGEEMHRVGREHYEIEKKMPVWDELFSEMEDM